MWRKTCLTTILLACGCNSGKGESSDDTGGGDDTGDTDSGVDDGVSPTIEERDVWCYQHSTGDKFYQWVAEVKAEDPQGADTLENLFEDGITALQGDVVVATYALVCDPDGQCTGSFKESEDGIACGSASNYTFELRVVDEDGNWSSASEVTGRQGTDATGR